MKYSLNKENIELTQTDLDQIDEKLSRLDKLLKPPYHARVVLKHDTHHRQGDVINCRVNIKQGKNNFYSERSADSVQTSLDQTITALKNEIAKQKEKDQRKRNT